MKILLYFTFFLIQLASLFGQEKDTTYIFKGELIINSCNNCELYVDFINPISKKSNIVNIVKNKFEIKLKSYDIIRFRHNISWFSKEYKIIDLIKSKKIKSLFKVSLLQIDPKICGTALAVVDKEINTGFIYGEWINHWETPKKKIGVLFQSDSISKAKIWGQHLIFKKDGTFEDVYYVPCKVGESAPHKYEGNWSLKENIITIFNLKEIYNSAHINSKYEDNSDMILKETGEFKIIELKNNEMHLEITKNYEQKSVEKINK